MTTRRRENKKRSGNSDRKRSTAEHMEALFAIEPYHRNEVRVSEIDRLRELIDLLGVPAAAEKVGVSDVTLLRVTSGFGHKLRASTAEKIREFLRG